MYIINVKKTIFKATALLIAIALIFSGLPIKPAVAEQNSATSETVGPPVDETTPEIIHEEIYYPATPATPTMGQTSPNQPSAPSEGVFMKHVRHMPKEPPPSFKAFTPSESQAPQPRPQTADTINNTVTESVYQSQSTGSFPIKPESVVQNVYQSGQRFFQSGTPFQIKGRVEDRQFDPSQLNLEQSSVSQEVYGGPGNHSDYPIRNKSGHYTAAFSPGSDKLLSFSYGNHNLTLSPMEHNSVTGQIRGNAITYRSIYPDTDLRYTLEPYRLKEDIIVQKYTGKNQFQFQISVSGSVYPELSADGTIHFYDAANHAPLFYMAKPFALDQAGSRCDQVYFDLSKDGLLKVLINAEWLKKAVYPITIDPTIYLYDVTFTGSGIETYWNYTGMDLGGGWDLSVNTNNLNLILGKALFSIPGRGIPIGEIITYNSLNGSTSNFGMGWGLGSDTSLAEQGDGSVLYYQGDGSIHQFIPNGSGGYTSPPGIYLTLQKQSPGNFTITDKAQNIYTYQNNKPTQIVDRDNNTTTYTYDGNGRLWKLRDPSGREITYSYNVDGKLASITDPANRSYQFAYQSGQLTTITDPVNNVVTIGYDANGYLSSFTDPLNRITSFTCDSQGKLQFYRDARTQGLDIYQTTFNQTTGTETVTTVTDPSNITETYYHNPSTGNLTKYQDMLGNTWTYTWSNNNLTSVTDAKGTTSYEYDTRGNVTKETITVDSNPANNIIKTMTYDDSNQLLEVVDGGGRKTSYKYSNKGNLLSTSNPDTKESNGRKYDQYGNVLEYSPNLSASYNLLKNGSFETWNYWNRYGGGAVVSLEGFQSHGNYALKMSSGTPVTDTFWQISSAMLYRGERFTLRADVKLDNVQSSSGGAVVKFFYGSGMWEAYYLWGSGTMPLIINSHVPLNSALQVYVGLENASGTVWFDGIQMERGNTLSSFNSVENSSFEEDLVLWNGFSNTTTTEAAWGGEKSAKLTGNTHIQQYIPVHGGESLTLSGMVKTDNLTGTGAYLKIWYLNQNYQIISEAQTGYVTGTQDFTRITCAADAPVGAVRANIYAILEGTGTAYFDSIKLVPRNSTKYTYNTAGNYVLTAEDPLKKQTHRTYNESIGTELSFSDALNHTTYYSYDNLDRLTEVTDPLTNHAYYQYDPASNLIATRDPRSSGQLDNTYRTQFLPNNLDLLDTLTDPLNRSATNTYDRSGRLIRTVLPNGREVNLSYDNAHRLTRKDLGGGKYFTYTYDGANNLTSITDQDSKTLSWTYDGAGRVTSATDTFNHILEYQWDKSNNLTLILEKVPYTGYGAEYYYDSDNKLTQIIGNYCSMTYAYDENGKVFQTGYAHVYNAYYKRNIYYYPDGRVRQIQGAGPYTGPYDRYSYSYTYYDNGNISAITSPTVSENFSYDSDGRLTSWYYNNNGNITQESYQYDPAGNLLTKGGATYTYNSANQITNPGFTYDNNGNLTGDGNFNYTYNSENQLTQVRKVSDGSLVAEYTYDSNGLRKSKTVNGVTTNFVWDPFGNLDREKDSSGNTTARYYYDTAGRPVAGYKSGGYYYYLHTNQRGDVVSLMSYYGGSYGQYQYDPWGRQISFSGGLNQPFRYAGYYWDEETGLYYCKSRYYSPTLGRFLTKDGYGFIEHGDPQTLNLYAYCGNNPVNYSDPTGHWMEGDEELHFSDDEYAEMAQLGVKWQIADKAGDESGKNRAHERANEIRENVRARMNVDNSMYINVNLSVGTGVGTTKGVYISSDGVRPYAGGFIGDASCFSITFGEKRNLPSAGWSRPSVSGGYFVVGSTDREFGLGIGGKFTISKVYVSP